MRHLPPRLALVCTFLLGLALAGCGDDHPPADDDHATDGAHEHAENVGRHHGILAPFEGEGASGVIELKLHDDKGDLELWVTTDGKAPFDLPLDSVVQVKFTAQNKTVPLVVRDKDRNEDEAGNANNRDGKTNYFIYPGDTGADAAWLQGKAFKAMVTVSFTRDGKPYSTKEFELTPHVH